jgi:hypothetical protein
MHVVECEQETVFEHKGASRRRQIFTLARSHSLEYRICFLCNDAYRIFCAGGRREATSVKSPPAGCRPARRVVAAPSSAAAGRSPSPAGNADESLRKQQRHTCMHRGESSAANGWYHGGRRWWRRLQVVDGEVARVGVGPRRALHGRRRHERHPGHGRHVGRGHHPLHVLVHPRREHHRRRRRCHPAAHLHRDSAHVTHRGLILGN